LVDPVVLVITILHAAQSADRADLTASSFISIIFLLLTFPKAMKRAMLRIKNYPFLFSENYHTKPAVDAGF
jgi:hypothetical protein